MCASMADIQSAMAEIRRGKKKEERKNKWQDENIYGLPSNINNQAEWYSFWVVNDGVTKKSWTHRLHVIKIQTISTATMNIAVTQWRSMWPCSEEYCPANSLLQAEDMSNVKTTVYFTTSSHSSVLHEIKVNRLECGPMPNVMVALPNIVGALCSTPQSLADAHY